MKIPFLQRLAEGKPLVADGATGTNLQRRGLPAGMSPDEWVFEQPEQVVKLHLDFIQAGSQIILTDTFGATHIRLGDSRLAGRAVELNQRAVQLAHQAADLHDVYVAGSMGPTGALLKPYGPLEPEQARAAFAEQAGALAQAGVDLLVIETQFDLQEALAALEGARQATDLPVVVSFSFDKGVRTMMGVKPLQVVETFKPFKLAAMGANCGKSLESTLQVIQEMAASNPGVPIWAKPNAGMPIPGTFPAQYDTSPQQMGAAAVGLIQAGAQIVGGCCGSSPEHIAAIAAAVQQLPV
jgi:5-methyltetrahydrofolate--homocysteine methyltransferase